MHNHFIEKCKKCQSIISQCRCIDPKKIIKWSLCQDCANPKPQTSTASAGYTQKSALQHGVFLADSAEKFLKAVNVLRAVESGDFNNIDIDLVDAELTYSDAFESLKSAIHEFKKRV